MKYRFWHGYFCIRNEMQARQYLLKTYIRGHSGQLTLSACCSTRLHSERHTASALCIPVLLPTDATDSQLVEVFWWSGNWVKILAMQLKTNSNCVKQQYLASLSRKWHNAWKWVAATQPYVCVPITMIQHLMNGERKDWEFLHNL